MLRLLCFYLFLLLVCVVVCPAGVCRWLFCSPCCHLVLVVAAVFVKTLADAADARAAAAIAARKEPPSRGYYDAMCLAAQRSRARCALDDCSAEALADPVSSRSPRGVAAACVPATADDELAVGANPSKKVSCVSAASSWCLSDFNPRTSDVGVCGAAGAVVTTLAEATPVGSVAAAIAAAAEECRYLFSAPATTSTTTHHHHHHRKACDAAPGTPVAAASLVFGRCRRAALGRVKAAGSAVAAAAFPAAVMLAAVSAAPTACGEHLPSASPPGGALWVALVRPFVFSARGSATVVCCSGRVQKQYCATAAAAKDLRQRMDRCVKANGLAVSARALAAACATAVEPTAPAPPAPVSSVEPMSIDIWPVVCPAVAAAISAPASTAMIAKQKRSRAAVVPRRRPIAGSIKKRVCRQKAKRCLRRRASKVCLQYRRCLAAVRLRLRAAVAQREALISARPKKEPVRRVRPGVSAGAVSAGTVRAIAAAVPTSTNATPIAPPAANATSGVAAPGPSTALPAPSNRATTTVASPAAAAPRTALRFVPRPVARAGARSSPHAAPPDSASTASASSAAANRAVAAVSAAPVSAVPDVVLSAAAALAQKTRASGSANSLPPSVAASSTQSSSKRFSRPPAVNTAVWNPAVFRGSCKSLP